MVKFLKRYLKEEGEQEFILDHPDEPQTCHKYLNERQNQREIKSYII